MMRCTLLSLLASTAGAFIAPSSTSTILSSSLAASTIRMPEEPNQPDPDAPPAQPKPPKPSPLLPTVEGASGQLDVISRLLKDRILLLGTDVNDEVANVLVAQLLYLANEDPDKDITLYINSPGGSVSAGLAITTPCNSSRVTSKPYVSEWPLAWVPSYWVPERRANARVCPTAVS